MLVSVHNEGWAHLRESQDQLADVFAKFNLADLRHALATRKKIGSRDEVVWPA
jgi:hypothetical protein